MKIITVDSKEEIFLKTKAEPIREYEWALAREIVEKLHVALKPYLPAAGLAAPQIGFSKAVFIFSFDRDPKHLEGIINPTFVPLGEATTEAWEGCLSTVLCEKNRRIARLRRFDQIRVNYQDLDGKSITKILEGFGARVFQHEHDHLQGIVNIDRSDAEVKSFESEQEMLDFIQKVKQKDAAHYKKPTATNP